MEKIYKIGEIPFYYTPIKSKHNPKDIPDKIEFSMETKDGIICQAYSDYTSIILNRAYNIGSSISGLMNVYGFGRGYADEFLDYLDSEIELMGEYFRNRMWDRLPIIMFKTEGSALYRRRAWRKFYLWDRTL